MTVRRLRVDGFAALEAVPASADSTTARRPVVFAHGFTGSKEDGALLLDRFAAAGYRALAYDHRGMYETPGPSDEGAYSVTAWAADLVGISRSCGGEPVHLIGHSFGGFVARVAVVADPAAFASVVLLDSGAGPTVAAAAKGRRNLLAALSRGGHEAVWVDDPAATPQHAAFMRKRFFATEPAALHAAGAVLLDPPPVIDALAATGVPSLVVYGAEEHLWPHPDLDALARRLGHEPVVIPRAGHSPNVDQPDATAAALVAFWRSTDAN